MKTPLSHEEIQYQIFKKIYWFLFFSTAFVFSYIILITFMHIPEKNLRFADTNQGFLLGTVIGGAFGYLVGGAVINMSKKSTTPPAGTTIADINASITSTPAAPDTTTDNQTSP